MMEIATEIALYAKFGVLGEMHNSLNLVEELRDIWDMEMLLRCLRDWAHSGNILIL